MEEFERLLFEVNNLKSKIELDQNHHGDGTVFDNLVAIYEQLAIISKKLGYDIDLVRQEYQKVVENVEKNTSEIEKKKREQIDAWTNLIDKLY